MTARGDIESVNLNTGERGQRVTGNGGSFLESLGIPGLKPVNPIDLAEYEQAMREHTERRGGLRPQVPPGCAHDWQSFQLYVSTGSVWISKCSKCHVLGMPPKEG